MNTQNQLFPIIRDENNQPITCTNCGSRSAQHVHHIIPRSEGGTDDPTNLLLLCQQCHVAHHSSKGDFKRWGATGGKLTAQKGVSIPNLKQFQGAAGAARWEAFVQRKAEREMGMQR